MNKKFSLTKALFEEVKLDGPFVSNEKVASAESYSSHFFFLI